MFLYNKTTIFDNSANVLSAGTIESFNMNRITILCEKGSSILVGIGQQVIVNIFDKFKGEIIYAGIIIEISDTRIIIENLEYIRGKQRREEVRVNVVMPIKIYEVFYNNTLITLEKYIHGFIVNLSANGFLLSTTLDLPVGLRFLLSLNINNRTMPVIAHIIRKENNNNKFYYGTQLSTVNNDDKKVIRQHVLQKQIIDKKEKAKTI